jgi:hypothetical protein
VTIFAKSAGALFSALSSLTNPTSPYNTPRLFSLSRQRARRCSAQSARTSIAPALRGVVGKLRRCSPGARGLSICPPEPLRVLELRPAPALSGGRGTARVWTTTVRDGLAGAWRRTARGGVLRGVRGPALGGCGRRLWLIRSALGRSLRQVRSCSAQGVFTRRLPLRHVEADRARRVLGRLESWRRSGSPKYLPHELSDFLPCFLLEDIPRIHTTLLASSVLVTNARAPLGADCANAGCAGGLY